MFEFCKKILLPLSLILLFEAIWESLKLKKAYIGNKDIVVVNESITFKIISYDFLCFIKSIIFRQNHPFHTNSWICFSHYLFLLVAISLQIKPKRTFLSQVQNDNSPHN